MTLKAQDYDHMQYRLRWATNIEDEVSEIKDILNTLLLDLEQKALVEEGGKSQ